MRLHLVLLASALAALFVTAGCGSSGTRPPQRTPSATPPAAGAHARPAVVLGVVRRASLPAGVQLPGLAVLGGRVLAIGGLDAADASSASLLQVAPGPPHPVGWLPVAAHDIGAAALGARAFAFGAGTAGGPIDAVTRIGRDGTARTVGRLPVAMSDSAAASARGTIYVVGGYTGATPLRSVLAYRPGRPLRQVATLPHPLRYAAVAEAGRRVLVAGGTDGARARRDVLEVDPAAHRVRVIARLPSPLAHAAGAVLGGTFFILGGRGDTPDSQRTAIWAVDLASRRRRRAGRLPRALSDLAAVTVRHRILVAGGRDAHGRAARDLWTLAPRSPVGARAAVLRPGRIPALLDRRDVYAAGRPGRLAPVVRKDLPRVYVPNSRSNTVDVIDQRTARVVGHFAVGALPQHVTPSWDLRTLWVTNDAGNSLTPIDPRTGRHGRPVPVLDPYNLYFTADGRRAIVVAEAHRELDFREPHTMRLRHALHIPQCAGIDHMDYTADGRRALVSCEFAGRMVVVDLARERVVKAIELRPGAMPQDVKLSPDGRTFYVADMASNGVWLIDAHRMHRIRLEHTGRGAHGLYPSRDSRVLYVSNRGEGTITPISFRTRRPFRTWRLPGGGSPDMGGLSADGRVLWLSGRYNAEVYAISTRTGRLLHRIPVGQGPHGLCVWPQPGRYAIGHTGILR